MREKTKSSKSSQVYFQKSEEVYEGWINKLMDKAMKGENDNMSLIPRRHCNRSRYFIFIVGVVFISCCMPILSRAQMSEVSERELSDISAQSGISYVIGSSQYRVTTNSYQFSDTDNSPHNWIELNNITIDGGTSNYFSMDTPETEEDFNTVDVGTDISGITSIFMNLSLNVMPRTYTVNDFVFCGQSLGKLVLENYRNAPSNKFTLSGRNDGTCGINLEYQTEMMIDSAKLIYNDSSDALSFNGIHLAQNASGDPTTPSLWTYAGKFKLGDMEDSNPVTIDVGTADNGDGTQTTSVFYNIPMTGSIRMESVTFGSTTNNFGPVAIDGLKVHHLGIQIPSK